MVIGPLTGTTFPFQMAFSWLINEGDPNHVRPSWDDPPSNPNLQAILGVKFSFTNPNSPQVYTWNRRELVGNICPDDDLVSTDPDILRMPQPLTFD